MTCVRGERVCRESTCVMCRRKIGVCDSWDKRRHGLACGRVWRVGQGVWWRYEEGDVWTFVGTCVVRGIRRQ